MPKSSFPLYANVDLINFLVTKLRTIISFVHHSYIIGLMAHESQQCYKLLIWFGTKFINKQYKLLKQSQSINPKSCQPVPMNFCNHLPLLYLVVKEHFTLSLVEENVKFHIFTFLCFQFFSCLVAHGDF